MTPAEELREMLEQYGQTVEDLAVLVDQAQRLQMQQLQTPPRRVGLLELIFRHKEE